MTIRSCLPYLLTGVLIALASSALTLVASGHIGRLVKSSEAPSESQPSSSAVTVNLQTAIHRCRQEIAVYNATSNIVSSFYDSHSSSYLADKNEYQIYMEFKMKDREQKSDEILVQCNIAANDGGLNQIAINGKEEKAAFFHMVAYSFKQMFQGGH